MIAPVGGLFVELYSRQNKPKCLTDLAQENIISEDAEKPTNRKTPTKANIVITAYEYDKQGAFRGNGYGK